MTIRPRFSATVAILGLLALAPAAPSIGLLCAQDPGRTLGFADLMQIRQVDEESISRDGRWVVFTAAPDRGDPEVVVRAVASDTRYVIPLAEAPGISDDGRWVAARRVPSLAERETADDPGELRSGMVLLSLVDGTTVEVDEVRRFGFAPGGAHLVWQHFEARDDEDGDGADDPTDADDADDTSDADDPRGTELVIHALATGERTARPWVTEWAFSEDGAHLAFAVGAPGEGADGVSDGVVVRTLASGDELQVHRAADVATSALTWGEHDPELAFWAAPPAAAGPLQGAIHGWAPGADEAAVWVSGADAPTDWFVPENTRLAWSDDGQRLFFTWRPLRPDEMEAIAAAREAPAEEGSSEGDGADPGSEADADDDFDPYDLDAILEDRGVDVWHWQDERIVTQQKVIWNRERERNFLAVRHTDGSIVALGDPELPDVDVPDQGQVAVAESDVPYRREATWTGGASDLYLVDLESGERTPFARGVQSNPSLSPEGDYVVWWHEGAYHLREVESGAVRILTDDLGVPFANEDHDYPSPVPGYGVAGWMADDEAVLIYDKYDIWVVPTAGDDAPWRLTDGRGRAESRIFRLVDLDDPIEEGDDLLLSSYHDLRKNFGFYRATAGRPGVTRLLEADRRFAFRERADDADAILYTREAYDEFPDLWVADPDFDDPVKVTDVNPGLTERFAWGEAELLEWQSLDGTPLQGVVIKPGNYEEGRRYPVLVYYYRFFSQRLHEFNDPSVNHRPSFPVYASDGYVVFLPDVRFDIGQQGFASTKSVVPGVQKLIDVGIADPDRIALHGHSWSGYQTAFMVTQTDIFRTAIAGAPVANMTSAYSGIRLGSGLARQFQYEQTQSRIGASMWEALDEYIENSPVFYADRIDTPMLILHGDVDDAVPWEQSIEMFLAMRRLDKEAVFLQYRDEPHHPQRYANKLDWAVKMKEWVDHYLKDAPAPAWISEGVPYRGR